MVICLHVKNAKLHKTGKRQRKKEKKRKEKARNSNRDPQSPASCQGRPGFGRPF